MFDLVQKNRRMVEVLLGAVVLGLIVSFGWSGYAASQGGSDWLAKVGNTTISEQQVEDAMRRQQGAQKPTVLNALIERQLVLNEARDLRLTPSDEQLRAAIAAIPAFQDNGQFSKTKYEQVLSANGMQPLQFQKDVGEDLAGRQLMAPWQASVVVPNAVIENAARLMGERREVVTSVFKADDYLGKASVTPAEIKQYYDAHQVDLKAPEMVRVEYLVLSAAQLAQQQTVSDAEIQKYFDAHKAELAKDERKAAHILIAVQPNASAADKQAAKAKAEAIDKQVKANPSSFAAVAKAESQDPGSKDQGGDLGWFAADAMVKPFADAAFKLSKGQISDVVESQFGYHIIMLEDARTTSLADVKTAVADKVKAEKAQTQYQSSLDKFNELVYQQADSLKPAADALKLQTAQSGWVTRQGAQDPALSNPKLTEALFSDDVLKKKHNTEAIEVQPGTLVSARVIDYKAAQVPPLATASPDIESKLKHEKAVKLAAADGAQKLAALQKGEAAEIKWAEQPTQLGRFGNPAVPADQVKAVFNVDVKKLPAYVGGADPAQGFVVYKVEKAIAAPAMTPEMRAQLTQSMEQTYAGAEMASYMANLQKKQKVEIRAAKSE
ncbi:SurA N-terminal domain-containing protein [Amantichitinum ursilacus]|uniref:Periplasmic chaperone PpiD n=1 Tax=Amantichitinum ursilacus TaxID=857265 RepID=A0A0N0XJN3_9NEIS|nr:SurA N-terminal domain-containing protein [Amantichitinum ursilacus]KPC53835.1 Peptidyl-prolyl cis-trans isomerase D [Amantichitinum ursilacus]